MSRRSQKRAAARASQMSGLSGVVAKDFDEYASGTIPQLDPMFPAPPRLWGNEVSSFAASAIVYRAVTIYTDFMRAVPAKLVDAKDDTKEVTARPTDAVARLVTEPNSIMSGEQFRELITGYELFLGGYVVVMVGADGEPIREGEAPVSLLPYPIKGWKRVTSDGSKDPFKTIGWVNPSKRIRCLNEQCIVSQTLDVSGRFGVVAPADVVRDAAETQSEIDAYQAGLLRNNGRPGMIISTSQHIKKPLRDRFMAEWLQNHGGPANAGRPALLTDAEWKIDPIESLKLGEITSVNQFRDSVRKIGMAFKIPEMEFGITENVHKESSGTVRATFLSGPVESMFRAYEAVWNNQFFTRLNLPYRIRLDQWALSAFGDVRLDRLAIVEKYISCGMAIRDAYREAGVPFTDNPQMGRIFLPSTLQELAAVTQAAAPVVPQPSAPGDPKEDTADNKPVEDASAHKEDQEEAQTKPANEEPKTPEKRFHRLPTKSVTEQALLRCKELGDKKRKALGKQIWDTCVKPFEEPCAVGTTKAIKRFKGYFLKRLNAYLNTGKVLDENSREALDASVFIELKAGQDPHIPSADDFDNMMMPPDQAVASLQAAWRAVFADVEKATTDQMEDELGDLSAWLSQPPEEFRKIALNRLGDAVQVDATTRTQLKSILSEVLEATPDAQPVQIAKALREEANHVFNNAFHRANTIARTEVGAVMGDYRHGIMQAQGVKKKRWSSAHDPKVRPTHAAAEAEGAIPMDQKFTSTKMLRPHDPEGPASEVCNCRCVELPA